MLAPSPRAPGIEYFDLYGLFSFSCAPLRASLQPHQCADKWRNSEPCSNCHGCRVGAAHAGQPEAPPPPTKPACCRCGRKDQRLIANSLCLSCYNRQRETLKSRNSKGVPPQQTGSVLRWGYALIQLPDAAAVVARATARHRRNNEFFTRGLKPDCLPGLPRIELMGESSVWFWCVTSSLGELNQVVSRLLPGALVIDADLSMSFAEQWRSGILRND